MSVNTSAKVATGSDKMTRMTELPLVLLHAFPLDSRMWNAVREPLASHLRVITPDQRGLGRSPLPETGREPLLEDAARDVVALLARLPAGRLTWAVGGAAGCVLAERLARSRRLSPPRRRAFAGFDPKIVAKFAVALVIGLLCWANRSRSRVPRGLFGAIVLLILGDLAISVPW